uniref:Uncharacterized protein n=1 Tax=Anguilla anguilla TaxID=7936 RepID=A0A0E9UQ56_ANGAN
MCILGHSGLFIYSQVCLFVCFLACTFRTDPIFILGK